MLSPRQVMNHRFREKRFYHRATRHNGEAYAPAVARDGSTVAYLQVSGDSETLMLQRSEDAPAIALSAPGYLFEPCFAGDWLMWVERIGGRWEIRGALWQESAPTSRTLVFSAARPVHLAAVPAGDRAWIAWEERLGRRADVCLARVGPPGLLSEPRAVGPCAVHRYDPALAIARDGTVYCAHTAYLEDNYRIVLSRFDADGVSLGEPLRVSDSPYACGRASLWPAARGGVWWSYTCFSAPEGARAEQTELISHVKHERYLRQRQCFNRRGTVQIGWCDGVRHWAPIAAPVPLPLPYHVATGLVFGSEGAGYSRVLEDTTGGLHVLLRQHAEGERALPCERASSALKVHERFRPMGPAQMHPNLSICSLVGRVWMPPVVIVPRAHFDLPINGHFDGNHVVLAFSEDRRRTGWSGEGEWFDDVGEIGLGIARLDLQPQPGDHDFRPLAIGRFPSGRLTNPTAGASAEVSVAGRTLALGQTHCHSNLSVCNRELDRDPHFNYRFMQDVQHCRFGALTDHDYNLWHTEMLLLRKLADYYDFPGEFVALPAYEWTGSEPLDCTHDGGPFGHFNVLGFEHLTAADFHTPNDLASAGNSPTKFWQCLEGRRVLTPPHHAVDYAHFYNWEFWSDEYQPVVELFQDDRGSTEQADAPGVTNASRVREPTWAVDELRRGRRFGFIAAGDHRGFALAGVWTKELTREALYAALRERACYGTTGVHAAVRLTCNGRLMGAEAVGTDGPAEFELSIESAQLVALIEVLRNGTVVRTFDGNGADGTWKWNELDAASGDFWYARVHWTDGELAWVSPVWL